jgi:ArsR family transcriptional regulator
MIVDVARPIVRYYKCMITQSFRGRRSRAGRTIALNRNDTCDIFHVDETKVRRVLKRVGGEGRFEGLARMFQVLADPTRVKLLYALAREELCVCDLASIVGRSRPAVSHQLRLLRDLRLVRYRRQGKMAYYSLVDHHVRDLVLQGLRHADGF